MQTEATFALLAQRRVLEIGDGYRAKNNELGGSGPIFLRAAYLQDSGFDLSQPDRFASEDILPFGKKISQLGDAVITTKGNSTGRMGQIRLDQVGAVYSPHLSYWRSIDDEVLDQNFLYYWGYSPKFRVQLAGRAHATDMAPYLSLRDQLSLEISLPSIQYQRQIGDILATLDHKIELNRRMNETLERQALALFRDWFVDFGPVKAKMAGDAPYLSPDLWSLFPDRLDDEGLPEGWKHATIGSCFRLTMGQSPPGETYNDEGVGLPFFQGRTDFGFRYPTNRKFCDAPTRLAERDDTLVSVRAPVGDINLAWEKCCIGRGVSALRHNSGSASFTYYSAAELRAELEVFEHTGTVFGAINKKQFEALPTVEPDARILSAFESVVSSMDARIRCNETENRTLAQTRDLLLPKLMSGEIRIGDAERELERA